MYCKQCFQRKLTDFFFFKMFHTCIYNRFQNKIFSYCSIRTRYNEFLKQRSLGALWIGLSRPNESSTLPPDSASQIGAIFILVAHKGTVFKCGVSSFIGQCKLNACILLSGLQSEDVLFFEEIELNLKFLCMTGRNSSASEERQ